MNYWIFKANPDDYHIDARLKDSKTQIAWRVNQHKNEIRKGDIAFIWRASSTRGICAVMRIDSDPSDMPELESEQIYLKQRDTNIRLRVLGALLYRPKFFTRDELGNIPGLENLSVFLTSNKREFPMGTNYAVTQQEGKLLMELVQLN